MARAKADERSSVRQDVLDGAPAHDAADRGPDCHFVSIILLTLVNGC